MNLRVVLLLAAAALSCSPDDVASSARSVGPVAPLGLVTPARFDVNESAAVFVGVRKFPADGTLAPVPYAVDDMVDLAYAFALERSVALVRAKNVVLALDELPQKNASRQRLKKLQAAGARTIRTRGDMIAVIEKQAKRTGRNGVFIVGLASHGFMVDGTPYVLTSTSKFARRETALSVAKVQALASHAERSLVFVDACREPVPSNARFPMAPRTNPTVERRLEKARGQAALSAGTFAYDDLKKQNGVFTAAVLDVLACQADRSARGVVNVTRLVHAVEGRVRKWIAENRDPNVGVATVWSIDGSAAGMPVAACSRPEQLVRAKCDGPSVTAFGAEGSRFWQHTVAGRTADCRVADLDGDGLNEVVTALTNGQVIIFDIDGTATPPTAPTGTLRKLLVEELHRKNSFQILTLSHTPEGSVLSIIGSDGAPVATPYRHPGRIEEVRVDQRTSRHKRKIVVWSTDDDLPVHHGPVATILVLDVDKRGFDAGSRRWYGYVPQPVELVEVRDHDNDRERDIYVRTSTGYLSLDFDGRVLDAKRSMFVPLHPAAR
jgi:hypothetical protein